MKLDYDCMRDVLLVLEEQLQFGDNLEYPELTLNEIYSCFDEEQYSLSEIAYTLMKLAEAGYICAVISDDDYMIGDIVCTQITFEGHQYLDTIRSPKIWGDIKRTFASKSINMTLDLILKVARTVIESNLF